jgi:GntR family transcriptional regulator
MIEFKLDPKSGIPFYRQIIDQIRFGIVSGKLKIGEQLPTVRALAVDLKVNLNTVSKAYRELEIQNVLETQQGTGTFIGTVKIEIPDEERKKKLNDICTEFFNIAASYGFSSEDIINELKTIQGGVK